MNKIIGLLLLVIWGFTAVHFSDLPEQIPMHYNASGQPDAFGPKQNIWFLPLLMVGMAAGSWALENKVSTLTEKNIFRWVNLTTVLLFGYIQVQNFLVALGVSLGLGRWFLPIGLGGTLGLIVLVIIKNRGITKND